MAQDMGLNRNSAKFQEGSEVLFTEAEKEMRNRIWWCALVLDKYVSYFLFDILKSHVYIQVCLELSRETSDRLRP